MVYCGLIFGLVWPTRRASRATIPKCSHFVIHILHGHTNLDVASDNSVHWTKVPELPRHKNQSPVECRMAAWQSYVAKKRRCKAFVLRARDGCGQFALLLRRRRSNSWEPRGQGARKAFHTHKRSGGEAREKACNSRDRSRRTKCCGEEGWK